MLLVVGIGESAWYPLLECELIRVAISRHRRMAHHGTEVIEERLRSLSFTEPRVPPLFDELLRCHGLYHQIFCTQSIAEIMISEIALLG